MPRKLKRLILHAVAGLLYYSGVLRFRIFFRRVVLRKKEVCVLGLHRVLSAEEEAQANSLAGIMLKEATFAKMLEFIKRHYRVISLQEFLQGIEDDRSPSVPQCLLTFDDGWRDNYTTAYPLLKKSGVDAVIFLVTGLVDGSETFWVEQLNRACGDPACLKQIQRRFESVVGTGHPVSNLHDIIEYLKHRPARERERVLADLIPGGGEGYRTNTGDRMLAWDEVSAMQRDGIEFEAHTVSHPLLVYENDKSVEHELRASKQAIEDRLGKNVRAFAYPNGTWDERVRNMVRKSGYECAFTTERGWHSLGQDRYAIRRIMLHEAQVTRFDGEFSPAMLSLRLTGWR
jgi:peptidoglycan/xylan/chitin deacetylase (PgdA/CDA1 family)